MSNTLLESLWARVSANIGDRIKQAQELLEQALSANEESVAARDAAVTEADRAKGEADRAASVIASAFPDATTGVKGKVRLAGDLAGTADAPTVPALANKADKEHTHTLEGITNAPNSHASAQTASTLMSRDSAGRARVNAPSNGYDIANKSYVDNTTSTTLANAKAYTDALIVEGNTSAKDGKLHIVYE